MKQKKNHCEKRQSTMLQSPPSAWPESVVKHMAECVECAAFAKTLEISQALPANDATPPAALDQAILRLARTRKRPVQPRPLVLAPLMVKPSYLAAAAMLVAGLMLVGIYTPRFRPQPVIVADLPAWQDTQLQEDLLLTASAVEFVLLSQTEPGGEIIGPSENDILSDALLESSSLELILGTDSETNGS
jgi:hypothetical protein